MSAENLYTIKTELKRILSYKAFLQYAAVKPDSHTLDN